MIIRNLPLETLRCLSVNKQVYNYVHRFYNRMLHELDYMKAHNMPPNVDDFFNNWTINFLNGDGTDYKMDDGSTLEPYAFYRLVLKESANGFFERNQHEHGVSFNITELGKEYILFKAAL